MLVRQTDEKPLAIDLYCGLGGWAEGFLAEGYDCVGFDIERHRYGKHKYPAQLVIQDVRTLHGSQFRNAAVIVASPPCQAYSYRAMPWKRAKALPPPSNELFDACFRIQREAIEATGQNCPACFGLGPRHSTRPCPRCDGTCWVTRYIPLVVENVRGAQPWVGRAKWHFGSYYLWGDLPALMPHTLSASSVKVADHLNFRDGHGHTRHLTNPAEHVKQPGLSGEAWFNGGAAAFSSRSDARKAASAMIAKIPFDLASHVARVFRPVASRPKD